MTCGLGRWMIWMITTLETCCLMLSSFKIFMTFIVFSESRPLVSSSISPRIKKYHAWFLNKHSNRSTSTALDVDPNSFIYIILENHFLDFWDQVNREVSLMHNARLFCSDWCLKKRACVSVFHQNWTWWSCALNIPQKGSSAQLVCPDNIYAHVSHGIYENTRKVWFTNRQMFLETHFWHFERPVHQKTENNLHLHASMY